ncbi:MAG: NUDIX hydrolase [Clostridia bacterium]|nr:NUDIX hydrolase [Clostridia bacterium]
MDTKNRVGVIIYNSEGKFLIEHAPNHYFGDNDWDLPKGHIGTEDKSKEESAKRECFEETGILLDNISLIGETKYKEGTITLYEAHLEDTYLKGLSDEEIINNYVECTTYFEADGKKWPEVTNFKFISMEEAPKELYKSLVKVFEELQLI